MSFIGAILVGSGVTAAVACSFMYGLNACKDLLNQNRVTRQRYTEAVSQLGDPSRRPSALQDIAAVDSQGRDLVDQDNQPVLRDPREYITNPNYGCRCCFSPRPGAPRSCANRNIETELVTDYSSPLIARRQAAQYPAVPSTGIASIPYDLPADLAGTGTGTSPVFQGTAASPRSQVVGQPQQILYRSISGSGHQMKAYQYR